MKAGNVREVKKADVTIDGKTRKPCALTLSDNLTTASVTAVVNFATEQDGLIALHDGVITQIVTAVPGLISVNNKSGYVPGRTREVDADLRASYANKIFLRSSRMIESVKSAILNNVPNVLAVIGYENETDYYDAYGRPLVSGFSEIMRGNKNTCFGGKKP